MQCIPQKKSYLAVHSFNSAQSVHADILHVNGPRDVMQVILYTYVLLKQFRPEMDEFCRKKHIGRKRRYCTPAFSGLCLVLKYYLQAF